MKLLRADPLSQAVALFSSATVTQTKMSNVIGARTQLPADAGTTEGFLVTIFNTLTTYSWVWTLIGTNSTTTGYMYSTVFSEAGHTGVISEKTVPTSDPVWVTGASGVSSWRATLY